MATLEELLNDSQIADDLEINFGDKGKFKVGDLRSTKKNMESRATAREKELKTKMDEVAAKQRELTDLATQAADLIEKAKATPGQNDGNRNEIDFETDALYAPLYTKKIQPLQVQVAQVFDALKKMSEDYAASARFVLQDYYERQWAGIPADKRPKDKGWKDYLRLASERKIFNDSGLPDPVGAFMREVEPVEKDNLSRENVALKAQIAELEKQSKMPRMPRPGAGGAAPAAIDKTGKVFENVDALVDAAFSDPLIQEIAGGGRPS